MSKLVGLTFLAILIGTTVVAGSRLTGSEMRVHHPSTQMGAFSPEEVRLKMDLRSLPVQKIDDRSFVFTENE
jgi:hypothetical protein